MNTINVLLLSPKKPEGSFILPYEAKMKSFKELQLSQPILQALESKGYTHPTAIQEQAIPYILEGRDIFGSAGTGTGKTAAFAVPLLQLMSQEPTEQYSGVRTLVLAPTRELAIQIGDSFRNYGKNLGLRSTVIYGGVSQHGQTAALRRGVDIIIATPGRLLDLINQGFIRLNSIKYLVLDEADHMLEMGFINDIKKIVAKVPTTRQTLFFSATVPVEIKRLVTAMLRNQVNVEVKSTIDSKANVKQSIFFVDRSHKKDLLCSLINEQAINQALVFTRTKRGADKLVKSLNMLGIRAEAIHGNKSQSNRQRTLADFKSKKVGILVATDVASRGIDVKELPYVINFDLPEQAETYTHRIGRTARAGATGIALSFCSPDERYYLQGIQRYVGNNIPVEKHAFLNVPPKPHDESSSDRESDYNPNASANFRRRRRESSGPRSRAFYHN